MNNIDISLIFRTKHIWNKNRQNQNLGNRQYFAIQLNDVLKIDPLISSYYSVNVLFDNKSNVLQQLQLVNKMNSLETYSILSNLILEVLKSSSPESLQTSVIDLFFQSSKFAENFIQRLEIEDPIKKLQFYPYSA